MSFLTKEKKKPNQFKSYKNEEITSSSVSKNSLNFNDQYKNVFRITVVSNFNKVKTILLLLF